MLLNGYADRDYQFPYYDKVYNIKKGEPLLTYSRGKDTPDLYVLNIPLTAYLDNSDGKTNIRYYRPLENGMPNYLLPNITVTPNGNYYDSVWNYESLIEATE